MTTVTVVTRANIYDYLSERDREVGVLAEQEAAEKRVLVEANGGGA